LPSNFILGTSGNSRGKVRNITNKAHKKFLRSTLGKGLFIFSNAERASVKLLKKIKLTKKKKKKKKGLQ